jgi:hypothetical protein
MINYVRLLEKKEQVVEKLKLKYEIPSTKEFKLYFKSLDSQNNLVENYDQLTLSSSGFSSNDVRTA